MVGLKSRGCRKLKKDEITKYEKHFEPKKKKLAIAQAIRQATPSIYVAHVSLYQYDDQYPTQNAFPTLLVHGV